VRVNIIHKDESALPGQRLLETIQRIAYHGPRRQIELLRVRRARAFDDGSLRLDGVIARLILPLERVSDQPAAIAQIDAVRGANRLRC